MLLVLWRLDGKFWNISILELIGQTKVTIVCCVLHNYCELCGEPEPKVANPARRRGDVLMGFGVERLPCVRKGKGANAKGEKN